MKTFTRKGYGRIFVNNKKDIQHVVDAIRDIDEFEVDYIPDDFITTFDNYPKLKYVHKFSDLDINRLTAYLWKKRIYVFCCDNGHFEYIDME